MYCTVAAAAPSFCSSSYDVDVLDDDNDDDDNDDDDDDY